MLHYSFSTIFMAFMSSSVIIIIMYLFFLNGNTLSFIGKKLFAFFIGLVLLRLLLPYEFPFTKTIPLPDALSRIISAIRHPWFAFGNIKCSLWSVFQIIWMAGIVFQLFRCFRGHRQTRLYLLKYGRDCTKAPEYKALLDDICRQYHKPNPFRILKLANQNIPVIFYSRQPYIILPETMDFSPDDLYFVLHHEVLHYFHHHFIIQGFFGLISIVYWWLPVRCLFQKQFDLLLEICVDASITCGEPRVTENYMECLLNIKKFDFNHSSLRDNVLEKNSVFHLQIENYTLKKRFQLMMAESNRWRTALIRILTATFVVIIYLLSHLYVLESSHTPLAITQETNSFTPENTYFIQTEDSCYEVYFYNIFIETITDYAYYPNGIKIYNKKGEFINET